MSQVRTIILAIEKRARSLGIGLPMHRLRDAIGIALWGRPYAALKAAENAGAAFQPALPPPNLAVACGQYGLDQTLFVQAFDPLPPAVQAGTRTRDAGALQQEAAQELCEVWLRAARTADLTGDHDAIAAIARALEAYGARPEIVQSGGGIEILVARVERYGQPLFYSADDCSISVYRAESMGADLHTCYDHWYSLCGDDRHLLIRESNLTDVVPTVLDEIVAAALETLATEVTLVGNSDGMVATLVGIPARVTKTISMGSGESREVFAFAARADGQMNERTNELGKLTRWAIKDLSNLDLDGRRVFNIRIFPSGP